MKIFKNWKSKSEDDNHLSFKKLPPEYIHHLYNIYLYILSSFKHDVRNTAIHIKALTFDLISNINNTEVDQERLKLTTERIHSQVDLLDSMSETIRVNDQGFSKFITSPNLVIKKITKDHFDINIDYELNHDRSLEVTYPIDILLGILYEIIRNAKKAKANHISIKSNFSDFWLSFTISDNGKGIPELSTTKKILLYDLFEEVKGNGLLLISSMISSSQGFSYIQKNKKSNGISIHFEIPVKAYYTNSLGTIYAK